MARSRIIAGGAGMEFGSGQAASVAVVGESAGVVLGRFGCGLRGCLVGRVVACFACCLGLESFFFGC